MKKIILTVVDAGVDLFGPIQSVALGWVNASWPLIQEIQPDLPETRGLAQRACIACRRNETVSGRYSRIEPSSWLLVMDVEGRGLTRLGIT